MLYMTVIVGGFLGSFYAMDGAYNDHSMQVTASQIEKYSTATFFQDARFFQNRASSKKASNVFACSLPLHLLYTHETRVRFCRVTFLPSNTARESLRVFLWFSRGVWGNFKQSQHYWWLARYDWPVSVWALVAAKNAQVEPALTPSYVNLLKAGNAEQMKGHQRKCHVPRNMNKSVDQLKRWCPVRSYRLIGWYLWSQFFKGAYSLWLCCWAEISRFP